MGQRLALISDVHGNAVALRAVLDDIEARGITRVVCLGDVATLGPSPEACIELVAERCELTVAGNHDGYLVDSTTYDDHVALPVLATAVDWARERVSASALSFLEALPPVAPLELEGKRLCLFHGSPRSNTENLWATTTGDELDAALAGHAADVFAGGHTHVPLVRRHRSDFVINVGSVGMPFEGPACGGPPIILAYAEYATLEVQHDGLAVQLTASSPTGMRCTRPLGAGTTPSVSSSSTPTPERREHHPRAAHRAMVCSSAEGGSASAWPSTPSPF